MQIITNQPGRRAYPFGIMLRSAIRHLATSGDRHAEATVAMLKSAQSPADTQTPGWAAELVQQAVAEYVTSLPDSVLGQLLASAIRVDAGAGIRVPTRTDSAAAAFVGEGDAIPVLAGAFGASNLKDQKLAIITAYTMELAQSPGAAPLVEAIAQEAIGTGGDAVLLSDDASTASAPAGLFAGVTPIAGTNSAAADLAALVAAVPSAIRPAFLMNDAQAIGAAAANVMQGGTIGRAPVIVTGHIVAGSVGFVDLQDLVFSVGDAVEITRTDAAALHMDDNAMPIVGDVDIAAPVQSLWQIGAVGVRLVLPLSWMLRRAARVALLTGAQW